MRIDPALLLQALYAKDLKGFGEGAKRQILAAKLADDFQKSHRQIAAAVKKKGDASIREILYHLWARGTRPKLGGEVANLIRDEQEARIVAVCAPLMDDDTPEDERIRIVAKAVTELPY
jgi:hypothetical protein